MHERRRLAAILGMLGSNSAGERDNAARMAEEFRLQHHLTWDELLSLPRPPDDRPAPTKASGYSPKTTTNQTRPEGFLILTSWVQWVTVHTHPLGLTMAYVAGVLILVCYTMVHD